MIAAASAPPRLVTLVLMTALAVLSLNMFLPSLSNMAATFGVDYALMTLSVSGYLGVTAVLQLFMGPLSDRYGRRPVMLGSLCLYCLGSLGCALAGDIWTFLVFRVVQGTVISGWALSRAIVRDVMEPEEAASRIGYIAMAMAIAPMLGPMIGGALDELFGWRASFWVYAGFGLVVLLLCWADLGETNNSRSGSILAQFRSYPDLARSRPFWGYALCMAFSTGGFYAFVSGAPLVSETVYGLSQAEIGVWMGTITAGFFLGSFYSARYGRRFPLSTMMLAGRALTVVGMALGLLLVLAGFASVYVFFGSVVFVGLGNGLSMPAASTGAVSVHPRLAGSASGLSGALVVGGGAVISSATGALVALGGGIWVLLAILLAIGSLALAAALDVRLCERRQPAAAE